MKETPYQQRIKDQKILIYGANGYTGRLFSKYLIKKEIKPIFAGRSKVISRLAKKHDCESRIFETKDAVDYLKDINIVINLASDFKITQKDLLEACIVTKTHYMDISDQGIDLLNAYDFDNRAEEAKIIAIPGAGFGVVPTDIAAQMAINNIDNATSLKIASVTDGKISRGSRKTFLANINKPGYIVNNGKLKAAKVACKTFSFDVFGIKFNGYYNPWRADLITSYKTSSNLKNIETYSVFPTYGTRLILGKGNWLGKLIQKRLINFFPKGPNENQMARGRTYIKAIASNDNNEEVSVEIIGPDMNIFTIKCLYELVLLLIKDQTHYGIKTPASFGNGTLGRVKGVRVFSRYEKNGIVNNKQLQHA